MRRPCERCKPSLTFGRMPLTCMSKTVGTLLSRSYIAGGSIVGAIFGTGTNGAYIEEVGKYLRVTQRWF